MDVFKLDGIAYRVDVVELQREFQIRDSLRSGVTMDGGMYRRPLGTWYHYRMTVRSRPGEEAEMEAFWKAVSQPEVSHTCQFPGPDGWLTQQMYVIDGQQPLVRLADQGAVWGSLQLHFLARTPQVKTWN